MGLLSSSKSSNSTAITTNNVTTNQDNRIAVTDDGVGFSIDGNDNSINITRTTTTTDYGAVSDSLDALGGVARDAVVQQGLTSRAAIDGANAALVTNTGTITALAGLGTATIADLAKAQSANLAKTYGDYSADLRGAYGNFTSQLTSGLRDAYADSASQIANANERGLNFAKGSLDNILNFGRDTLEKSSSDTSTALAAIRVNNDRLTDYLTSSSKSGDERAFTTTVPWLVAGAVLVVIFWSRSKA